MIKKISELMDAVLPAIQEKMDVAVVGLSGGADSTLVALLCREALGAAKVYGVHMPCSLHDHDYFNCRSKIIAKKIGIKSLYIPVTKIVAEIDHAVEDALEEKLSKVNSGNSRARARMSVLYSCSHTLAARLKERVRVVGTGNLSEDFIGYDTKGGDALADFFPIGSLFKSEVYQLLAYFRDQKIISESDIDRKPSAGLWDNQSDEDELGYSYSAMEPVIKKLIKKEKEKVKFDSVDKDLLRFVIERYAKNSHKHTASPVISLRKFCD